MKMWLVLALLTAVGIICEDVAHNNYFLSDNFINQINSANLTWRAKQNFDPSTSQDFLRDLLGVLPDDGTHQLDHKKPKHIVKSIPKMFDARETWSECPSIGEIFNQGSCDSGWAVASANAMSDRLCIHSTGNKQVNVSVENLLRCASTDGCAGGSPTDAFKFWHETGVVSEGCQSYTISNLMGEKVLMSMSIFFTSECHDNCEEGYPVAYEEDKTYGDQVYSVGPSAEKIQEEMMTHGPVAVTMEVYPDFGTYSSGVYQHHGLMKGYQAVRLLGWGEDNGTPFWLAANSWGDKWGERGFFKILRGKNDCGIEKLFYAALPKE